MDDLSLLRKYVEDRDEQAFAEVVRRHVDLVYSAARRQLSDPSAADDVTQLVFVTLAGKARALRPGCVLAAWLLSVTRNVAMNANTAAARRRLHELRAAQMKISECDPGRAVEGSLWDRVAPHLDEGVAALPEGRRRAIVLRYFERKSVAEVALQLQVSEDAAKQRLSRGVDQLRAFFARRGVVVSVPALGVLVAANAVQAAPPAIVAASTAAAAAASATSAAGAGSFSMKGVAAVVALGKTKAIAVGLLVASLFAGTVAVVWSAAAGRRGSDGTRSAGAVGGASPVGDAREAAVSYNGVVRTADGRPVGGAEVFFPSSQPFFVSQMGVQNVPMVKTGADGGFSTPAQAGVRSIVVRFSAGYAQVPARGFVPGTVTTVQPWGRIEGGALVAGKPAAGRSIVLASGADPREQGLGHLPGRLPPEHAAHGQPSDIRQRLRLPWRHHEPHDYEADGNATRLI